VKWTDKQLKTIETRGKNVLVSAAAGSGKTAVLTERILRLVTKDKVPLKELLVVTFTEAAASEMKSRIAAALTAESETDAFAEEQLRQLGTAKIMTFHAFCLTILKKYCYMIELDPSFAIADEKRAEALMEDALDKVVASAFADEDEEFRVAFTDFLLNYADVKGERKIREKLLKAYGFIMTLPDPFSWLAENVGALFTPAENLAGIPAIRFAYDEIAFRLALARSLTEQTGRLLLSLGLSGLAAKNDMDLESVLAVERRFGAGDAEGTKEALEGLSFERFHAKGGEKEVFENVKELVKVRRDRVKNILRKEIVDLCFAKPVSEYADEIAHIAPHMRTLETLVKRFAGAYAGVKRAENMIDFADFEHMALKILEDESIADDYRRRFTYIFIDEYQDSNYVQEALISRVSRVDNVFMVGDVKQSIYSWRNAAPEIFLEKQDEYGTEEDVSAGMRGPGLRIDLSSNFRSKACVINAVNAVFETVMERHYSGMEYDKDARLEKGISYEPDAEGKVHVHLIKKDSGKESFGSDEEGEAALCASIIRETAGRMFYDAKLGIDRPVRYSDIAILLRAASGGIADVYRKILESQGIPAVTDRGEGYFETVEVDTFLALLRAIVNLRRDVPLAAAMCSDVFGFGLPELADIRTEKRDGFFHSAFLAYAENGPDAALREKCIAMTERLLKWRDEERFMRLDDFLWKLLRESGFYDYVSTLTRGAHRQANLRALLDRAADFQSGRVEGLRGFLAFLDKIKLRGGAPQVTLLTEGEDVCRIMTIHGSKGLEFPVTLLCGMGKQLSRGGFSDDSLLLHRDVGLSLQWRDHASHTHKKTLLHSALKLKQDTGERAESIRLLYVAMTRAMDTLHMIGTMSDPEKTIGLYGLDEASPAVDTDAFKASSYFQLILPTVLKRKELFSCSVHDGAGADTGGARTDVDDAGTGGADGTDGARTGTAGIEAVGSYVDTEAAYTDTDAADANTYASYTDTDAAGIEAVGSYVDTEAAYTDTDAAEEAFVYPYAASAKLKSKYSVTELNAAERARFHENDGPQPSAPERARFHENDGSQPSAPDGAGIGGSGAVAPAPVFFMSGGMGEADEDAGLSAAERGTALHKALELLDFREARAHRGDRAWFEEYLGRPAGPGEPGKAKPDAAVVNTLMRFANTDLAARASASGFLIKEAAFNMKLPYREATGFGGDEEEIVVQGVIDCLFEEDGGLVIVDYKTSWFNASAYEREADRIRLAYGRQLLLYRRAAELIFDKPVRESLIYMTRAGVTVEASG